jgi:hypothetical protein
MKPHIAEVTLQGLESMNREELIDSLVQFASYSPISVRRGDLKVLPTSELMRLARLARRRYHARGY